MLDGAADRVIVGWVDVLRLWRFSSWLTRDDLLGSVRKDLLPKDFL
jgi:hypothetical protein